MQPPRLPRAVLDALAFVLPRRFHTRPMSAGHRVKTLTPHQREELAKNLRRMLAPKTA
jgi:hypothetical protein